MSFLSKLFGPKAKSGLDQKREPMPLGKGDVDTFGTAKNALEVTILAMRNRQIEMPAFFEVLLNSDVFILANESQDASGAGGVPQLKTNTSVFSLTEGETTVCFYSHIDRTKPTSEKHPEFKYALNVRMGDIVTNLENCGIVLNPFYDANMAWTSTQVSAIKRSFRLQ